MVHEDTVNLKPLLPVRMNEHDIHFSMKTDRLYVYLIEPGPRPVNWPVVGPRKYQYERIRQIYPK